MYNNRITKIDYINAICTLDNNYVKKLGHLHYLSLKELKELYDNINNTRHKSNN
jgi:hypothetical protein